MNKVELKARILAAVKDAPNSQYIRRLSLFGSQAYGTPREDSDVDILVEFEPGSPIGLIELCGMENYFRDRLHNKIDLRTPGELNKRFRDDVLTKAEPIYEKR